MKGAKDSVMADIKNDPSELYDADFIKKREEMHEEAESSDTEAQKIDEKIADEEYSQDAFEEKSGLFSKLRKKSKDKKKEKKQLEDSYKDSYDIFDLEELMEQEEKAEKGAGVINEPAYGTHGISDINALLESVGIMPISDEEESSSEADKSDVAYEPVKPAENDDLGKTKVIDSLSSKLVGSESVSEKTKSFDAIKISSDEQEHLRPDTDFLMKKNQDENPSEHQDGQIILEGYADDEGPSKISEKAVEVELKNTRRNLIDNFRVLAKGDSDKAILEHEPSGEAAQSLPDSIETVKGEDLFEAVAKAGKKKKASEFFKRGAKSIKAASQKAKKKQQMMSASALSKSFKKRRKKRDLQSKILFILAAVSLVFSIMASAYSPGGALDPLFGNGARVYIAISLVLLVAGSAVIYDVFKRCVETIISFKANSSVLAMLLAVFVAVHHIAMLVTGMYPETGMTLYTTYVLFVFGVQCACEAYSISSWVKTISFMAKAGKLTGVQQIDNKADASALGHGICDNGEPKIWFGADVDIPTDLEEIMTKSALDEKFYSYSGIAVLLVSFVYALILSITTKNAAAFTGGLISSVCLCLPLLRPFVTAAISKNINKGLVASFAAIAGLDACEDIGKANAVVFDTEDIFDGKISKFRRVPGCRMAVTDAIVYTASTLKGTKCILAKGFDEFLEQEKINLPEAEDVVYEERLGYSSWVAGRKVLVGNREMLVQHSVEVPSQEEEQAYSKGKSVMYVVVEGVIAATFIATYSVRAEVRRSINSFNKTGLILMLNTGDPCLNEAAVSARLGADIAAIKIISSNGSEIVSQYRSNQSARNDNGLVCAKKQKNLLSLVTAAHNMFSAQTLAMIINIVGIVFSFVLMVVCVLLKVSTGFSAITIIILQLAWNVGAYFTGNSRIH